MIKRIVVYTVSGIILSLVLYKLAEFKLENSIFVGLGTSLLTFLGDILKKKE